MMNCKLQFYFHVTLSYINNQIIPHCNHISIRYGHHIYQQLVICNDLKWKIENELNLNFKFEIHHVHMTLLLATLSIKFPTFQTNKLPI